MTNIDFMQLFILIIVLVISIVGHEYMHGRIAYFYGDNTAKNANRLTLNPIKHVDIFGTILVPGLLFITTGFIFGWAKPVPVNTIKVLENGGVKGAVIVSLAGIFYNLALALISFLILKNFFNTNGGYLTIFLWYLLILNLILAIFNFYPFPPLDGSRALAYIVAGFGYIKFANFLLNKDKECMIILMIIIISPLSIYFLYPIKYLLDIIINHLF